MRPILLSLYVIALLGTMLGCTKKDQAPAPVAHTVLTGYYSLTGLYVMNANGTYTAVPPSSCLIGFLLNLKAGGTIALQDACLNIGGTWLYANGMLTVAESTGTVLISGAVSFKADGITIDVDNTVDNLRYELFRN
jgi:hypothetical protein